MTNLQNPEEENKSNEGLPEIAKKDQKTKNPWILIIVAIFAVFFIGSFFMRSKSDKPEQQQQQVEESYNVASENKIKNKNAGQSLLKEQASKENKERDAALAAQQLALIQEKQKALQQRLSSPLMLVDEQSKTPSAAAPNSSQVSVDPNTRFMNQVAAQDTDTANAKIIGPFNYLIAEGGLIHAVLETAVNSDLPGKLRAIVSQPVYSEDGSQVLIPEGSRLIGQYKSGMPQGQSRVFVVWTRLITPRGITISLGSPGVDNLGIAGMGADAIDHHFWEQFGTAILLSIIGAGADNINVSADDQYNAEQAYKVAVADSFAETADQMLKETGNIPPTIHINQGKPIMVFVARDLNFQEAMKKSAPKLNVF